MVDAGRAPQGEPREELDRGDRDEQQEVGSELLRLVQQRIADEHRRDREPHPHSSGDMKQVQQVLAHGVRDEASAHPLDQGPESEHAQDGGNDELEDVHAAGSVRDFPAATESSRMTSSSEI